MGGVILSTTDERGKNMALRAYGKRATQAFLDEGTEFKHETIKGMYAVASFGRLPEHFRYELNLALENDTLDRVIYSYNTPIAWRLRTGKWIVPEVHYSVTTLNHQNVVRMAIEHPGFYKDAKW